jgi:hypothetical protein
MPLSLHASGCALRTVSHEWLGMLDLPLSGVAVARGTNEDGAHARVAGTSKCSLLTGPLAANTDIDDERLRTEERGRVSDGCDQGEGSSDLEAGSEGMSLR